MKSFLLAAFVVGFYFFCEPAGHAGFCIVPDVPDAIDRAEAVFSGRIVDIVAAQKNSGSPSEYVVKFEVQEWWKGNPLRESRVLWRTEMFGCSYYRVGEVGERYLVYADPPKSELGRREKLLEVTIFNRTSMLDPSPQEVSQSISASDGRRGLVFVNIAPELNRMDGSNDIEALRRINACGCFLPYSLPSCMNASGMLQQGKPDGTRNSAAKSPCCACLRRTMTNFSSGFPRSGRP